MTDIFRVIDHDIIYLSYDEPNAEKNYADLALLVHKVKHKFTILGLEEETKLASDFEKDIKSLKITERVAGLIIFGGAFATLKTSAT